MDPIDIENISDPLPTIRRALSKEFPKAGIVGVGFGARRRDEAGRILKQGVIRVMVRKKKRPLPRSERRIPPFLTVRFRYLSQIIRLKVPTDVQERPKAAATRYEVKVPGKPGSLTVAAYARWESAAGPRFGVVTAGHGCWGHPSDDDPLEAVSVILDASCPHGPLAGKVVAASHLKRDHVDAALVDLGPAGNLDAIDPCLGRIWASVDIANEAELRTMLGGQGDDLAIDVIFDHYLIAPGVTQSVAYFESFEADVAGGWGVVKLMEVVETQGETNTFVGGTSGAALVTNQGSRRRGVSIQSLCLDPDSGGGLNRWGVGTSLWYARQWLSDAAGAPVTLSWDPNA